MHLKKENKEQQKNYALGNISPIASATKEAKKASGSSCHIISLSS